MHLISMSDVSELKIATSSPMPKDYKDRFTSAEIEDLLAFLGRQSIRDAADRKNTE